MIEVKGRRHTPEQIIRNLREADRLLAEGRELPKVAKHLEISEATFHRWRNQYGGLKADEAKRLKELKGENTRLKRIVADKELEIDAPAGDSEGRSYRSSRPHKDLVVGAKSSVDLASQVALEASDDFEFGSSFGGAPLHVGPGASTVAKTDDGGDVQSAVGGSVASAVEPVPGDPAGRGGDGRTPQRRAKAASDRRRSGLSPMVTSKAATVSGPMGEDVEGVGGVCAKKRGELMVESLDLLAKCAGALGDAAQSGLCGLKGGPGGGEGQV